MSRNPKKLKRNGVRQRARVLIVEDQPVTRHGLRRLLERQPGIRVCGEAGNYERALAAIARSNPALVTVEIQLNHASGLDLIKEVRLRFPPVRLLVISQQDEVLYAERALRAGALGYIHKRESLARVVKAVQTVLRGGIYVSEEIASKLASKLVGRRQRATPIMDVLTDRELRVFGLVGEGFGPIRIAEQLQINKSTVETYRARIKQKLRFHSADELRREAILWAHREEALR
ncbi:MAG TPA: response regulator transcription factor [bacterium]|nr:response regulator transcription factor [bacterium]